MSATAGRATLPKADDTPSPLNNRLAQLLLARPTAGAHADLRGDAVEFLREHRFPVSEWPMFLAEDFIRREVTPAVGAIPRIFHQAIRARFGRDAAAFSAYFGWPPLLYEALLASALDPAEALIRYDAVLGERGMRLIEINCSSSLGGWPLDWLQPQVQRSLAGHAETATWNVHYRPIFPALIGSVLETIQRRKRRPAQGHLLFHAFTATPQGRASLAQHLQQAYDVIKPPHFRDGRIVLFSDFDDIGQNADGDIVVDGTLMDAVVMSFPPVSGVPDRVTRRLTSAYLAGRIAFPDSPLHTLLGDKLLFALVHECVAEGLLDPADASLIERYVPWTAVLRDVAASAGAETLPLAEYVARNKDAFVLKRANSYAGKHVFVGRYTTAPEWRAAIDTCLAEGRWIVQEFCAPGPIYGQDPVEGMTPHEAIWGIFAFGMRYAGAFVRAHRLAQHRGVINAANGATEFLVFEHVQPPTLVSALHGRLLQKLAHDSAMRAERIDMSAPPVAPFLRGYGSAVSMWPLCIDKVAAGQAFDTIVANLPRILYQALRARFGEDGQAFADYFGWPRLVYDVLLKAPVDVREIIARYDLVATPGGYRILELNCSSAVGGWQTDWLAPAILAALDRHGAADWRIEHRPIFHSMLRHVLTAVRRLKRGTTPGAIVLYAFVRQEPQREALRQSLQAVYNELQPVPGQGRILLFTDFAELGFDDDHSVSLRGEAIDALLLTIPDAVPIPDETLRRLNLAYLSRRLFFPDSPFHTILDSKLNFAVLHECRQQGLLPQEASDFVERHVPWTAVVQDHPARWDGPEMPLTQLLVQARERLVLKKADSFGGRHVHIGHCTAPSAWRQAISLALSEGGWIAQEFCAPERIMACDPASASLVEHELIWGVFGMGTEYGGAFVRGLTVREGDGVINSANGAVEFVVFETSVMPD